MRDLWERFIAWIRLATGLRHVTAEEREMMEEMQFHIDREAERLKGQGLSDDEARRQARLAFGGTARWVEAARDEYRSRPLEEFGRDVRYALRSLRHAKTFTAAVVLTLAIGIGATSTVYTVTERVVLRPLSYGSNGELAILWGSTKSQPEFPSVNSYPDYVDFTAGNPDIQYASIFNIWTPTLNEGDDPEPLVGSRVSADFFKVLGVRPMLGRDFRPEEDVVGGPNVVVISHSLWRRKFHADSGIVGRDIRITEVPYRVIGVMPEGFRNPEPFLPGEADVWRPLSLPDFNKIRIAHFLRIIVRFKPGVTIERGQRNLSLIASHLATEYPKTNDGRGVRVVPMLDQIVGGSRTVLFAVLGASLCLLLIVCGNVASLVLTRYANRESELALRGALGAASGRLTRLLLAESLVLGILGGILGLGLCFVATTILRNMAPEDLPRVNEIVVDWRVVAVTTAVSVGSALVFGLLPALRAGRRDIAERMREGESRATDRGTGRGLIVLAELAMCVMLLASAGLLTRSLLRMNATPTGIDTRGLLAFRINLPGARYKTDTLAAGLWDNLLERLSHSPGLTGAAVASYVPFTGMNDQSIPVVGSPAARFTDGIDTRVRAVSPGYFAVMRQPVVGREFTANDTRASEPVAIINRMAAAKFFPGKNPLGERILLDPKDTIGATIVGVVPDLKFDGPGSEPARELFRPEAQGLWWSNEVIVRTTGRPEAMLPLVRSIVRELDPKLPLVNPMPLQGFLDRYGRRQRFYARVFGLFGLTALILSAVGVYGLIAFGVVQRRREIAIRMALGASPGEVLRRFVSRATALIAGGVVLGGLGSLAVGKVLSNLLFQIQPTDAPALIFSAGALTVIALVASVIPAFGVRRVSPSTMLR